jgi:hypothetical protein
VLFRSTGRPLPQSSTRLRLLCLAYTLEGRAQHESGDVPPVVLVLGPDGVPARAGGATV